MSVKVLTYIFWIELCSSWLITLGRLRVDSGPEQGLPCLFVMGWHQVVLFGVQSTVEFLRVLLDSLAQTIPNTVLLHESNLVGPTLIVVRHYRRLISVIKALVDLWLESALLIWSICILFFLGLELESLNVEGIKTVKLGRRDVLTIFLWAASIDILVSFF